MAGIVFGARLGGYALLIPAATCATVAVANLVQSASRSDEPVPEHAEPVRV